MALSEVNDTRFVLVSARKSRGGGHWDKDDYDVRLGDGSGPVVGHYAPPASTGSTTVVLDDNRSGATAIFYGAVRGSPT
jgi:hypothetical protein